ncbi:J-type chaperone JAC1 [Aspergillus saccharolyticus JOP 1030-1]|uniref:Co-chaperone Hsc20 n=1 Tax=Aspergillus saccharolyticus JOP 1030-1 TaxID=1450539 RepID=A0A318ZRQ2_9EURO|nr:Co-chaperone Hsc20 [Aspergillus saccharolyticus JOP 1030-1]PYH46630.1 Co-chaperone Hsc20 [Aspergillus saccharolyticus JOP 1030-1]
MATPRLAPQLFSATCFSKSAQTTITPRSATAGTYYYRCHLRLSSSPLPSPLARRVRSSSLTNLTRSFTTTSSYLASSTSTAAPETPDITNHYTIFRNTLPAGPPPQSPFAIPAADLRREFLQWQSRIHPDKYPSGPQKQQAEALSARINEAYRTLLDPLLRAQYLLREMHGIDVTAEDGATKHALDAQTLMEVMEVQETIEEVGAEEGAEETIQELKRENEQRVQGCVRTLEEAFDRGDIEKARTECIKLRFWYSVGEGLREWEPGTREIRLVH